MSRKTTYFGTGGCTLKPGGACTVERYNHLFQTGWRTLSTPRCLSSYRAWNGRPSVLCYDSPAKDHLWLSYENVWPTYCPKMKVTRPIENSAGMRNLWGRVQGHRAWWFPERSWRY